MSQALSYLQGLLASHELPSLVGNTAPLPASPLDPLHLPQPSSAGTHPARGSVPLGSGFLGDRDLLVNAGSLCWDRAQNTGGGRRGVRLQGRVASLLGSWLFFP